MAWCSPEVTNGLVGSALSGDTTVAIRGAGNAESRLLMEKSTNTSGQPVGK